MHPRALLAVLTLALTPLLVGGPTARAATVAVAYETGHHDVTINGYGTDALGSFVLTTDRGAERAWCTEAHVAHTTRANAYAEVPSALRSPELDALVWSLSRESDLDDDTATAAAALIWYYAGARRSIGPAVWSDGARGFAAISPTSPEPWDALPALTMQHPVGLRASGIELDAAERRVAELHRWATSRRGPWQLGAGARPGSFVVRGPAGPISGATVRIVLSRPGGDDVVTDVTTGSDGTAAIDLPRLQDGATVTAHAESPGPHRAWDAAGDVQRLVTATTVLLTADVVVPTSSTTTTTTTITSSTTTSSTTTTSTVPATTTSSTTTSSTTTSTSTSSTTTSSTTTSSTTTVPATTSTPTTTSTVVVATPSTVIPPAAPPTLPRTGSDAAATALRAADAAFVVGVGLSVLAALSPRRRSSPDARTAGRRSAPPFGR